MSKYSSAKYYKKSKEKLQIKARKRYQDISEKKTIKSKNMMANNIKIFLSMKSRG